MELYVFLGLVVVYFITYWVLNKVLHKKVWTLAFLVSFVLMGLGIVMKHLSHHKGLSIWGLDEYYILYLSANICFLLGLINLWLYKKEIYRLIRENSENE